MQSRQQQDGIDILLKAIGEFWALVTENLRKHPEENGETYVQHFLFATTAGIASVVGGVVLIVHGFLPFVLSNSAGDLSVDVAGRIQQKRAKRTTPKEEEAP